MSIIETITGKVFTPKCAAVIVAGGSSTRMNGVDKMLADVAGKPMILRTAEAFQNHGAIQEIIVVARPDIRGQIETILKEGGITKLKIVINGGATRTESVNQGVNWVSKKIGLIAVHDGARPMVTKEVITDAIAIAAKTKAAVPGIPVHDTIRICEGGIGTSTPDRNKLYAMQTPQVVDADLLRAALVHCLSKKIEVTDEAAAVEQLGMKVNITKGAEENIKVTTKLDLAVANALARRKEQA